MAVILSSFPTQEDASTAKGKHFYSNDSFALGLATIAEGVENTEQLDTLRELGCEDSQGFLLAIPMPAEDATRWMEANAPLNR
jgi:predicted signal transduction protein with EAL and GGDEF domain